MALSPVGGYADGAGKTFPLEGNSQTRAANENHEVEPQKANSPVEEASEKQNLPGITGAKPETGKGFGINLSA